MFLETYVLGETGCFAAYSENWKYKDINYEMCS